MFNLAELAPELVKDELKLPQGKHCDECGYFNWCVEHDCADVGKTTCRFYPRKFFEKKLKVV